MPRVREGHFEQKKHQILEAAKRVCAAKPLYSVTMKDIVLESGMSQGGVYKYFSNIDAVYVAILNEATRSGRVYAEVDALLSTNTSEWQKVTDLLRYAGQYARDMINSNGKIYFELLTLYANEPARLAAVKDQLTEASVNEYLFKQVTRLIAKGVADKTFAPVVPIEDLFAFLMTSFTGITQGLMMTHVMPEEQRHIPALDVERVVGVLALSVRMLLGGSQEGDRCTM